MDQLETLRLFVSIAEQRNLSAVARKRMLAPSTVTLALKRLEAQRGVALVRRTTRRLSLTEEGERFLDDCRRILADFDAVMRADVGSDELSGEIRVTCTHDLGRTRLPGMVDEFLARHPAVRMSLELTDAVLDIVEQGFDLGLRTGPLLDARLRGRILRHGGRRVVAAPAYWDRHGRPAHPRELRGHNCLYLGRPGSPQSNWRFRHRGREFCVDVQGNRSANDGGVLRRWAIDGAGVVLKAEWDIREDLQAGRLESVLDDYRVEDVHLYAVQPLHRPPPRRVEAFLDLLAERLAE